MNRRPYNLGLLFQVVILALALLLTSSGILASTTAETGSITIIKYIEPEDVEDNFEFQLDSPGNPEFLLNWGSQGTAEGQFEWTASDVDIDDLGNIYVADESNHRIQKFDSEGNFLLMWGKGVNGGAGFETCEAGCQPGIPGTAEGEFDSPRGIVVDDSRNMYVVDSLNNRIQKFNSFGHFVSTWGWGVDTGAAEAEICASDCQGGIPGSGDGQFFEPKGAGYSSLIVYIVDKGNHRIQKFDTEGNFDSWFGGLGDGEGQFNSPSGITLDNYGNVFVADTLNYRVQRFGGSDFVSMWGWGVATGRSQFEVCSVACLPGLKGGGDGQFNDPLDVGMDKAGYVYVADSPHTIQKFDFQGNFVHKWGVGGSANGEFNGVAALALDFDNSVYAVDINNYRIQKFLASSFVLNTIFGESDGIPDRVTYDVPAGTYTVRELYDSDFWILGEISCQTSDTGESPIVNLPSVTINLDPGEEVTCTYTNLYEEGSITIVKEENPPDGTDFNFLWGDWDYPEPYIVWGEPGSKESQFNSPAGLATDSNGDIYIVDKNNNRIQKFDTDGVFLLTWGWGVLDGASSFQICTEGCRAGSYGTGDGQFDWPEGVAVDSFNNVYVVDRNNHRIQKFDSDGNYLLQWGSQGTSEGLFEDPNWVAVDGYDNVYVVDRGNMRIQKFDSTGSFILTFGWGVDGGSGFEICTGSCGPGASGSGDGQFASGEGIAASNADKVYVADSSNNRLQVFDLAGGYLSKWGSPGTGTSEFDSPVGVSADSEGDIYVADKGNDRIQKFDGDGNFLSTWGSIDRSDNRFVKPYGIATDNNYGVYSTHQYYQTIHVYRVVILTLDDEEPPNDDDNVDGEIKYVGNPGTYKVMELEPEGDWRLKSITCVTNDTGDDPIIDPPSVTINLDKDEEITCTFYNTIYEDPVADFEAAPTEGIPPLEVQFTNNSTGDIDTCSWDFGDGGTSSECDPTPYTYDTHGLYTVSLTVNGPEGEDTETKVDYITVYEPPQADFSATPTSGVAPMDVDFTDTSTGDYDTCSWDFGDGGTSSECTPSTYTYNTPGVYTVVLTVSGNGGEDTETKTDYISVYEEAFADFSATPTEGIAPLAVDFTNESVGDYDTCSWDFGDEGTSSECEPPTYTYNTPGVYTVSLTISGGGADDTETKMDYITVYEEAKADFSATPTSGVAPLDVDFTNNSTGDYDTCSWDFGDGGTSSECAPPTYTYNTPGVYTVSLTVSGNGGEDTETKTDYIAVYEEAQADFSATPTTGIAPMDVDFTNNSTGDYDTCSWDFGDSGTSSVCAPPTYTYNTPGVYTVVLTVSGNGGEDTETKTDYITVYEEAQADFSATPTTGIAPLDVDFTNNSTGDYDTCSWDFGDSGTSSECEPTTYTYTTPGVYTVSLTVSGNGGEDTETKTDYITVYEEAQAAFSAAPTSGVAPMEVDFTNNSTGDYDTCSWDFGDEGTSTECTPSTYTYNTPGVYTVVLTVSGNGGEDTETKTDYITVYEEAQAAFIAAPTTGIASLDVDFTNNSTGDYDTCNWDFGDGGTSSECAPPTYTYNTPGVFTVSLTVSGNGGEDTETKTDYITVYEESQAAFSAAPTSGIAPLDVDFTNNSTGDYDTCSWDFGDGGTSSECAPPTYTYNTPGVYAVSLTVSGNGGEDTETKTDHITVYEESQAAFSATPTSGVAPLTVDFDNLSIGDYDTCSWDFGDGGTYVSCGKLSHIYSEYGVYTVTLTVSGNGGEDTEIKVDYIVIAEYYYNYMPIILDTNLEAESTNIIQSVVDFLLNLLP